MCVFYACVCVELWLCSWTQTSLYSDRTSTKTWWILKCYMETRIHVKVSSASVRSSLNKMLLVLINVFIYLISSFSFKKSHLMEVDYWIISKIMNINLSSIKIICFLAKKKKKEKINYCDIFDGKNA